MPVFCRIYQWLLLAGSALVVGCSGSSVPNGDTGGITDIESQNAIAGRYIVIFDPEVIEVRDSAVANEDGQLIQLLDFVNQLFLDGTLKLLAGPFVALNALVVEIIQGTLPPDQDIEVAMRRMPGVLHVEPDRVQRVSPAALFGTQQANWGLDRVDQRELPLDGRFIPEGDGAGAHLYIVDTGILPEHREFEGRLRSGRNLVSHDEDGAILPIMGELLQTVVAPDGAGREEDFRDCNGHGTHVAGTAAGTSLGVAQQAWLHAVRVFDCSGAGATSTVIAGIDSVIRNHDTPAIMNLSLSGDPSPAMDHAVRAATDAGITVVAAAGNGAACALSPARSGAAITVGATDRDDRRSGFSEGSNCIDLMAPGSRITSAWHISRNATNTISGTSMAAPHVSGAAALLLAADPALAPDAVAARLNERATPGVLQDLEGSPDRLLYVGRD